MAFEFIKDREVYFNQQYMNSEKSILPLIEKSCELGSETAILEIGCSEAGVLKVFTDRGCKVMGIELREEAIELAKNYMASEIEKGQASFLAKNIYDIDVETELPCLFDCIILKDVIEHIPDTEKLLKALHSFLKPTGMIFIGWPPWQMPFGGHQQMCESAILSRLPYFHLLPPVVYRGILKAFGESEHVQSELLSLPPLGVSIEKFQRIIKASGYSVSDTLLYFINPIYEYKFGLKTVELPWIFTKIPIVRNFLCTSAYYLISKKR